MGHVRKSNYNATVHICIISTGLGTSQDLSAAINLDVSFNHYIGVCTEHIDYWFYISPFPLNTASFINN